MMGGLARAALSLLMVWLLGALLLGALRLRHRRWPLAVAQPFLDLAVGAGCLSIIWVLAALLGWQMTRGSVYLVIGILALAALLQRMARKTKPEAEPPPPPMSTLDAVLTMVAIALVITTLAGVSLKAYSTPYYWDGRYIWAFKAKAMYLDEGLSRDAFSNLARYRGTALDHPLIVPSLQAWVYQNIGHIDERLGKLVGIAYWLGVMVLIAAYLRRRMAWPWALTIGLLACQPGAIAYHAGSGVADVPLAFCVLAAGVLLVEWAEAGRNEDLILSALMLGMAALIKPEGISFAAGGMVAFLAALKARPSSRLNPVVPMGFAAGLLLPVLPWLMLRVQWSLPSLQLKHLQFRALPEMAHRFEVIGRALAGQVTSWPGWELTWILVIVGFVSFLLRRGRGPRTSILWLLIGWQLLVDVVYYQLCSYDINWILNASLVRLLVQVAPLGVAAAVASLAQDSSATPCAARNAPRSYPSTLAASTPAGP